MNPSQEGKERTRVRLEIVEGAQAGGELEVIDAAVIGRSSTQADLILDDLEASRRHASLTPEEEALTVEDLGSTNGTYVNGVAISGPRALVDGDRLRIGKTVLKVHVAPSAEADEGALVEEFGREEAAEPEPEPEPDEAAEPEPEEPTAAEEVPPT